MAQKVLDRVNRRAHFVRVQDKPQIGALVQQIIGCMRERKEFYLEEVKGLTLALLLQVARWNREEAENTEFEAGNSSLIHRRLTISANVVIVRSRWRNWLRCAISVKRI